MKVVYPTIFTPLAEGGYMAYAPDLEINTQGEDLAETISMARDAISFICVDRQDDGKPLPEPSMSVAHSQNEIVSWVDADLTAYRAALSQNQSVRV